MRNVSCINYYLRPATFGIIKYFYYYSINCKWQRVRLLVLLTIIIALDTQVKIYNKQTHSL